MYSKMKDSGIEWIGDIPSHWEIIPNKHIMYKVKDICLTYSNEDILSLSKKGVTIRDFSKGGKVPSSFDGYQRVYPGNLLLCLFDIDVTPRCVGVIKNEGLTSPAYSQFILKDDSDVLYYYYYYLMLDEDKTLVHLSKNLRHSLTEEQLGILKVIKPPIEEQKKISIFLDKKISTIDDEIDKLIDIIEKYYEYKKSVISEVVTTGLDSNILMKDSNIDWIGEIPEDWDIIKAKFLFDQRFQKGNDIELQLLSSTQKFGVIPQTLYEELSNMTAVKVKKDTDLSSFKCIHKHDFCISLRSFEGGFEYCEYEGVVSPAYSVFFPVEKIDNDYYKYLFKEYGFIENMKSYCMSLRDGKNISFEDFGNTHIPYPPLQVQSEIANYLDEKCKFIDSLILEKEKLIKELEEYKKSLIFEYVTGKKEVP